ncbi:hypothetical protein [Spirosoma sp.]|uniref:hypothetical protein n=1 Tax=Spirosoma sp. TaxID=1899569 RepID=UPI002610E988|nr:hypothetical protein [Spirosoma sp.]MCX6216544.1 hypothetical protein [Spirosoma sp.]
MTDQNPVVSMILDFSRNELLSQIKPVPNQGMVERQILSRLNLSLNKVAKEIESGQMGKNQILSLSVSAYPLGNDTQFLCTLLYRPVS